MQPNISIIVALAENNAIGKDNDLLWHISDDLRRFKALTTGHPVIMGHRTFDSLPRKPLPKRRNIVLTHNKDFYHEGVEVAHTVAQAAEMVRFEEEAFVIGGAAIYRDFLPIANRLYVTLVHSTFDADVFFPPIDLSHFQVAQQSPVMHDEASNLDYSYIDYLLRP